MKGFRSTNLYSSKVLASILIFFFQLGTAQAAFIDIQVTNYGSTPAQSRALVDQVILELETEVNSTLPQIESSKYLVATANANTVSGAGVGVDYVSPFKIFLVGVSGGFGYDLNGGSLASLSPSSLTTAGGFAGQYALMLGFRLDRVSGNQFLKRSTSFIHFSSNSFSQSNFNFKASSLGLHWQYKAIPRIEKAAGAFTWNGLDLTWGFRTSTLQLNLTQDLSTTYTDSTSVPGTTITTDYQGSLVLGVNANTSTIPLEASTGVRMGYLWTLFSGFGLDINWGKVTSSTLLSGPVSFQSTPSGAFDGVEAAATLDLGDSGTPQATNFRAMIGSGIELGIGTLTLQYNKSFVSKAESYMLGLRLFY